MPIYDRPPGQGVPSKSTDLASVNSKMITHRSHAMLIEEIAPHRARLAIDPDINVDFCRGFPDAFRDVSESDDHFSAAKSAERSSIHRSWRLRSDSPQAMRARQEDRDGIALPFPHTQPRQTQRNCVDAFGQKRPKKSRLEATSSFFLDGAHFPSLANGVP